MYSVLCVFELEQSSDHFVLSTDLVIIFKRTEKDQIHPKFDQYTLDLCCIEVRLRPGG